MSDKTFFFSHLPALRQYDHYKLECDKYIFALHLLAVLEGYKDKWSPVQTKDLCCEIVFSCDHKDIRERLQRMFETDRARALLEQQHYYPDVIRAASAMDVKDEMGDCECPLEQNTKQVLGNIHTRTLEHGKQLLPLNFQIFLPVGGNGSVSIWMDGTERIKVLGQLFTVGTAKMTFRQVDELPWLAILLLAHLDCAVVHNHIECWPLNGLPPQLVAGVALCIPGQPG
jgi:hypothetical protein